MKTRNSIAASVLALIILSSGPAGADMARSSVPEQFTFPPSNSPVQAEQKKPDAPAPEAPPTREQILKEGEVALKENCIRCHGSDKWEGTNRDHDGWAAIVNEMSRQMAQAQMPPMSEKTTNLIIDYLTLTRPQ